MALDGRPGDSLACARPELTAAMRPTTVHAYGFVLIAAAAAFLRFWNIGATFESSDQAAMAYLVRHSFGLRWIVAHDYGPVLPLLHVACAAVFGRLGWPIGEAAARLPLAMASLAQVAVTYALMRRLGRSRGEGLLAAAVCTVLPPLVTDAHYPWGMHTVWLLAGSVALWASLAWFDERRCWQCALAGAALFIHCLSSAYAFALPVTLLVLWGWRSIGGRRDRAAGIIPWAVAVIAPCVAALTMILASWWMTGAGQLGHLLRKGHANEAFGLHSEQVARLPGVWISQLGLAAGVVAAMGLAAGLVWARRKQRIGLLAVWAWTALVPFTLVADWGSTGYACYYLFEVVHAAALLAVALVTGIWRAWPRARKAAFLVGGAGLAELSLGSVDVILPGIDLQPFTAIRTGWGDVHPDSGAKGAGWYVRRHVPEPAVIMTLHDRQGMEVPVAEYYLGRQVLADYDLRPDMVGPVLTAMLPRVDLVIADATYGGLMNGVSGFAPVCTVRRDGRTVRWVYARERLRLPRVVGEARALNARYDQAYRPRRVPIPLACDPGFEPSLAEYQRVVRRLRSRGLTTAALPPSGPPAPRPGR